MKQVGPGSSVELTISSVGLVLVGAAFVDVGTFLIGDLLVSSTFSILSSSKDGNNGVSVGTALGSVFSVGGAVAVSAFLFADFIPNFVGLVVDNVHIVRICDRVRERDVRVSVGVVKAESDGLTTIVVVLNVVKGNLWRSLVGVVGVDVQLSNGTSITKSVCIFVIVTDGVTLFKLTGRGSSVRPDTLDSFSLDITSARWRDTGSSLGWIIGREVSLTVLSIGVRGGWKTRGGSQTFTASVSERGLTGTGEFLRFPK